MNENRVCLNPLQYYVYLHYAAGKHYGHLDPIAYASLLIAVDITAWLMVFYKSSLYFELLPYHHAYYRPVTWSFVVLFLLLDQCLLFILKKRGGVDRILKYQATEKLLLTKKQKIHFAVSIALRSILIFSALFIPLPKEY